jgi:adenylate kinase
MDKTITLLDKQFELFISESEISEAVARIANAVASDYKDEIPIFIGVLNGAFMFVSDFLKSYSHACEVSFVKLSSYSGLTSTGLVKTLLDFPEGIQGRSVIILEDIVDTGRTVQEIYHLLSGSNVKSFRIATLFFKSQMYKGEYPIDYFGIEIPDRFIVGYGLDYQEQGRNLRHIYQLKQE